MPRPIRHPAVTRRRQRTRSDEPVAITFAGRITPEKGLAVLIEALGSVRSDSRIELCIAGVVEHQAYWSHCRLLEQRATMANAQLRVRYLGHLDYAATDELFSRSDIVAVPSQWPEPFGAVALEAMSAGATVIASQIGGLDTCLDAGHCGLLVEPSDSAGGLPPSRHCSRPTSRRPARGTRPGTGASLHRAVSPRALDQAIRRARTPTRVLIDLLRRPPRSTLSQHHRLNVKPRMLLWKGRASCAMEQQRGCGGHVSRWLPSPARPTSGIRQRPSCWRWLEDVGRLTPWRWRGTATSISMRSRDDC